MSRSVMFGRAVVVALMVPGLLFAAPVPGPCGQCERGVPCPAMDMASSLERPDHGCCTGAAGTVDSEAEDPTFPTITCECGREAAAMIPSLEGLTGSTALAISADAPAAGLVPIPAVSALELGRPPAPPPTPPLFLAGCAFLT